MAAGPVEKFPRVPATDSVADLNPCNLDRIYNTDFSYCVGRKFVAEWLKGVGFGQTKPYSPEEQKRVQADIEAIYSQIMSLPPHQGQVAYVSAGAPGAGKTTVMERLLQEDCAAGIQVAYIDPDAVCLKQMEQSYLAGLEAAEKTLVDLSPEERLAKQKEIRKQAYDHWRPASNAANHIILANLIRDKLAFYFGTTASSPFTAGTFKWLKDLGYRIHLIHVIAPDAVRCGSVQERDKEFVQTTDEDIAEKGLLVPQRIHDTYLKYADRIDFYYRNHASEKAVLTATWVRTSNSSDDAPKGELRVHTLEAYKTMVEVHNAICDRIPASDTLPDPQELLWENSVERASF